MVRRAADELDTDTEKKCRKVAKNTGESGVAEVGK